MCNKILKKITKLLFYYKPYAVIQILSRMWKQQNSVMLTYVNLQLAFILCMFVLDYLTWASCDCAQDILYLCDIWELSCAVIVI